MLILLCLCLAACAGSENPPAPITHYGTGSPGRLGEMTVRSGDSVYAISQRYGVEMRDLIQTNRLSPPYHLQAGQRLKLPPPRSYTVRTGDTLSEIARMFDASTAALARRNNLSPPYLLHPGQRLDLTAPTGLAAVTRTETSPTSTPRPPATTSRQTTAAPARSPPVAAQAGDFIWPVRGRVISGFGPKPGGLQNDGINIATVRGTPVQAAASGRIAYSGNEIKGFGNLVLIQHETGWVTAYAHLQDLRVKRGDQVRQGATIGTVGATGTVSDPQLHFEIRRGREAFDPQSKLGSMS